MRLLLALATTLVFVSQPARAFFTTLDTGEVIQPEHYRAMLMPQLIFDKIEGTNVLAAFDTGIAEDQQIRGFLGIGEIDFQVGANYKWVPFPDVEGQPAIGLIGGIQWMKIADDNLLSLRVGPLVSKKVETEVGDFTPYASLPIGLTDYKNSTYMPIQFAAGTEWRTLQFDQLTFMTELGLNITKAYSYLALGVLYYFDETGIRPKGAAAADFRKE
jgi:hypothetical protein